MAVLRDNWPKTKGPALALGLALVLVLHGRGHATMPVNPDRPMIGSSCAEAQMRLREARAGSPLLGAAENRAAVRRARRTARRLCNGEIGPR